jgi:hypothetical protein
MNYAERKTQRKPTQIISTFSHYLINSRLAKAAVELQTNYN